MTDEKETASIVTRVDITVFKPMGYAYHFWAHTTDRGVAVERVIEYMKKNSLGFSCVNTIDATHVDIENVKKDTRVKEV